MSLTERTIYDKVEVVGNEGWTIQWRKNNQILKDGAVVGSSLQRGLVEPVQASYDLLVSKLNARGITFITVENSSEDWISSFDTAL